MQWYCPVGQNCVYTVLKSDCVVPPAGYDFSEVLRWFGERVDRIILLFDAHKLDISDEFSEAIKAFKGQDDKIRVVLNKADQVGRRMMMIKI